MKSLKKCPSTVDRDKILIYCQSLIKLISHYGFHKLFLNQIISFLISLTLIYFHRMFLYLLTGNDCSLNCTLHICA